MTSRLEYYIFNKPYDVLSQFTKEIPSHKTLADYINIDRSVYPIGRLDRDSEGLLLLTNDNTLKTKLLNPSHRSPKTYLAQVDGMITDKAIETLRSGVSIKLKSGRYNTMPCEVKIVKPKDIADRIPPIRKRANIPTSWIEITIVEGKNRQIRKMSAAVGYPCLRLIRIGILGLRFDDVQSGRYRKLTNGELHTLL